MSILPSDPEVGCGYGIFKLSSSHPFTQACALHDHEFDLAAESKPAKTRAQADWELFYRWVLIAKSEENIERRMKLVWEICTYWPLARLGGALMWDGDPTPTTKEE